MRFFHKFTKFEKLLILFLVLVSIFSFSKIVHTYFYENSFSKPAYWGVYTEAAVWDISLLNPLFSNLNPIDRDINSLIFRWLMKYEDWKIVDDIATHTLSVDQKTYIFKVKEWIKWHDWRDLSVDDVYFTYHDILQSPDFDNEFIKDWLDWVEIKKISDNEISFTLKKPYKFFLTNLIIWILPRHSFEWMPVSNIILSEFNFENPVWLWPYKFRSLENFWNSKKLTLVKFEDYYWEKPYIDTLEYMIYKEKPSLLWDVNNFSAVRPSQEKNINSSNMKSYEFVQSKYVAAFFNADSEKLKNEKVRLWIQLWTDKNKLLETIWEKHSIDTPLLELNNENWVYEFDQKKSMWALHESWWKKPEKTKVVSEHEDEFKLNNITSHQSSVSATWSWSFFIEWKAPEKASKIFVNDYQLKAFSAWDKEFNFKASEEIWTLKEWENTFTIKAVYKDESEWILDTLKIFYIKDKEELAKKEKEIESQKKRRDLEVAKDEKDKKENLELAKSLHFRVNEKWEILTLKLITDKNIEKYSIIADELKNQWAEIWVDVEIFKLEREKLQEVVEKRDYDVLIYGQSLWYNLDTYSYWHSSQAWENWLNFSNLNNFKVDVLIEKIRSSHDEEKRNENLKKLAEEFQKLTPAVFLYSPTYYYFIDKTVKWVELNKISNVQDRFSSFESVYVREEKEVKNPWFMNFVSWLFSELINWWTKLVEEEKNVVVSTGSFLTEELSETSSWSKATESSTWSNVESSSWAELN